jgi:hypothetical protein
MGHMQSILAAKIAGYGNNAANYEAPYRIREVITLRETHEITFRGAELCIWKGGDYFEQ